MIADVLDVLKHAHVIATRSEVTMITTRRSMEFEGHNLAVLKALEAQAISPACGQSNDIREGALLCDCTTLLTTNTDGESEARPRSTRRSFLKYLGVGAASTALVSGAQTLSPLT